MRGMAASPPSLASASGPAGPMPRRMDVHALLSGAVLVAAVDPVPWARARDGVHLAFHIILVPLGVSWAFMTLIANYRGLRHDDRDARWRWPSDGPRTWP